MEQILLDFRRELRLAERLHLQLTGVMVHSVANFDRWMQSHFDLVMRRAHHFVVGYLGVLLGTWYPLRQTPQGALIQQQATALLNRINTMLATGFVQTNFYVVV